MNTNTDRLSGHAAPSTGRSRFSAFGSAFVANGFTMYPVLAVMVVIGAIVAPSFLTVINLINILEQVSVLGLTTIGLSNFRQNRSDVAG